MFPWLHKEMGSQGVDQGLGASKKLGRDVIGAAE
jgi:hypothetical protein